MIRTASMPSHPARRIHREKRPGLEIAIVPRDKLCEFHITLLPLPGESLPALFRRLSAQLREHDAVVVKHDVHASIAASEEILAELRRAFGEVNWPVTCVEGGPCSQGPIAGMQVYAVSGAPVRTVFLADRAVGRIFHDAWSRHCLLGDVRPPNLSEPKPAQARRVYELIEAGLSQAGMVLSDIVRTWLFLDDILSWYGPFNSVRTEIFTQRNVFREWMPASTGIGAKNVVNAALIAGAWAIQSKRASASVCEVPSPLQCPARSYGSCFSRAIELSAPDLRRLLVSGTASIYPDGTSARSGDAKGQVNLTMDVVEAILASRKMSFGDVTRATAYFKTARDGGLMSEWCAEREVPLPVIVTQSEVCREELLFEIELDAMSTEGQAPNVAAISETQRELVGKAKP